MSRDDWFRNTEWNEAIEIAFEAKLRRARDKAQYLRIQACHLAPIKPEIALKLLSRYFELAKPFDWAQAFVDQAKAHLALGSLESALRSYESALASEAEFPNLKTTAYVDYPYLVATQKATGSYQNALKVLNERSSDLMFPLDSFKWHASKAIIQFELGDLTAARTSAGLALQASEKEHSGFRYHPKIGVVGGEYESVRKHLRAILAA